MNGDDGDDGTNTVDGNVNDGGNAVDGPVLTRGVYVYPNGKL